MLGVALVTLAAAAADGVLIDREEVLIDLDPGGLVWSGLDVDDWPCCLPLLSMLLRLHQSLW